MVALGLPGYFDMPHGSVLDYMHCLQSGARPVAVLRGRECVPLSLTPDTTYCTHDADRSLHYKCER